MKVIILCGGQGTRLREETEYRPKPMVPIGGRPILWHIMKHYAHYGHNDFVLCLGYRGDFIKNYFLNYQWNLSDVTIKLGASPEIQYHTNHQEEDWKVTLVDTGQETMTGGRVKRAMKYIEDQEFLLTYGDGLSNHDINASVEFHRVNKHRATLTAVMPEGRFGELIIEGSHVNQFSEKPGNLDSYINGGFFVCDRSVADLVDGDDTIFERQPLQAMAAEGSLGAFRHDGFWQCMDTYRESLMLNELWDDGKAKWKLWV